MTAANALLLMSLYGVNYWPYGPFGQHHPPEDPWYGTPSYYDRWVDFYWGLQPPYYAHDICRYQSNDY